MSTFNANWPGIRWFKSFEFDSPDQPGSGIKMSVDFVRKLDTLRADVNMPLVIASGYRTPEHNAKVGGVDSSAHESGHAADIVARSSGAKFRLVEAAMRLGFKRIGVGSTFVHLDDDQTKPPEVLWLYPQSVKRG